MLKKISLGMAMTMGLLLSGCSEKPNTAKERAIRYMNNKTNAEVEKVIQPLTEYPQNSYLYAQVQSNLDSVAYRDVFEKTQGAKDSAIVSEFNTIASKAKPPLWGETTVKMKNNLLKTRIKRQTYVDITSKFSNVFFSSGEIKGYELLQLMTDSINYRNFFNKHKLLDEKTLKHFKEVTKKIRP